MFRIPKSSRRGGEVQVQKISAEKKGRVCVESKVTIFITLMINTIIILIMIITMILLALIRQ